ncbi:hypothetical protein BBJ28_00017466 [Nothophytophthora sp. Chile5]|nr:hypothetical protein BBJ28_00017466 [Nothophytophthora sp. Chile5]
MVPIIQRHTLELQELVAQASATHEVLDVYKLAKRFTLETFVEIGFGRKLGLLASGLDHPFEVAFDEAHHTAAARFNSPAWLWKLKRSLNIGSERHLREDMVVINQFVMEIIASAMERRQLQGENPAHGGDLEQPLNKDIVSIVLDTMEASGHAVTPTEVRDIALAGLIAGRDTTGDSLSWLLHMLHQNPRVEGKLRAEILATIPKMTESESYMPSMEEVQSLQYLEATVREVLRLFPPVPIIPYNCIRDTVFPDGTFIPVGTDISLLTYASGRIPSVWGPDAADFLPERFLDGKTGNLLQMPPTKFAAFSAGPRVCVGRNLAMLEMKIVITCLVSRFYLAQVPGQDVRYIRGVTLGMKNPLLMQVESIAVGPEVVASTPATHA